MRKIKSIIIHHSASPETTTTDDIWKWHTSRGWDGIGYHYVILPNGKWEKTRPNWKVGMHAYGSNRNSIGICLIGSFQVYDPTEEQIKTLKELIGQLKDAYGDNLKVIGHRDTWHATHFKPTRCPGNNLHLRLKQERIIPV